jgi:hypothetical protein
MKAFVFLMMSSIAVLSPVSFADDRKSEPRKPVMKGKKAEPKAGSQEWGRFSSNGNKSLAVQEQNKQAKKNAAAKK